MPGVNIVITNEDTGGIRETVSTAEGGYFAAQMLPGRYRIQANIVFDGDGNTDEQRGSNVGVQTRVANESIAEVQILVNQFDAEWGRASWAVINAVTKSDTNT